MIKIEHCKKLIAEKQRGENAHAELLELLGDKIKQAYYARGAFIDKPFNLDELRFDYETNQILLNYSAWRGEFTPDRLRFDIDEFLSADFAEEAKVAIANNKIAQRNRQSKKEQKEREMLAKLKQKYGE